MTPRLLSQAVAECVEIGAEGAPERNLAERAERGVRALTPTDPRRVYGVCVGGGMVSANDEYADVLDAVRRAEELRAELDETDDPEPVQILLWRDDGTSG